MKITDYISYNENSGVFTATADRCKIKAGDVLGSKTLNGYLSLCFDRKVYLCHRLAFLFKTGSLPDRDVDHINGCRSDNRWANLRLVTRQQNMFNRFGNISKELPRNIYLHTSGKFRVKMKIDGKTRHFGYYSSLEEASKKANEIRKEYHKEYAKEI